MYSLGYKLLRVVSVLHFWWIKDTHFVWFEGSIRFQGIETLYPSGVCLDLWVLTYFGIKKLDKKNCHNS